VTDRLFPIDEIPEVPLFRPPRVSRGAPIGDERLSHDYPPEWSRCRRCGGLGFVALDGLEGPVSAKCGACLGMGSVKAMVRLLAGHRCERCGHPYIPKGDAKKLGIVPSGVGGEHMGGRWSACDERCTHDGRVRVWVETEGDTEDADWLEISALRPIGELIAECGGQPHEAEWRILTVHHLDGDKANLAWWNLAALCQRCHLEIQAKVVLERVYPYEHSDWFKPHVGGFYAKSYLRLDLTREEVMSRLDELLDLERTPA